MKKILIFGLIGLISCDDVEFRGGAKPETIPCDNEAACGFLKAYCLDKRGEWEYHEYVSKDGTTIIDGSCTL